MKKLALTFVLLTISATAFAHGNPFSMTADSISAAAEKFEKEEAGSMKQFTGVKGWPVADKIQVKVYLSNNATINYLCFMVNMGGNDMMMCDKQ